MVEKSSHSRIELVNTSELQKVLKKCNQVTIGKPGHKMSWAKSTIQIYNHQPGCVKGGFNLRGIFTLVPILKTTHFGKNSLKSTKFHSRLISAFHIKADIYILKLESQEVTEIRQFSSEEK